MPDAWSTISIARPGLPSAHSMLLAPPEGEAGSVDLGELVGGNSIEYGVGLLARAITRRVRALERNWVQDRLQPQLLPRQADRRAAGRPATPRRAPRE